MTKFNKNTVCEHCGLKAANFKTMKQYREHWENHLNTKFSCDLTISLDFNKLYNDNVESCPLDIQCKTFIISF